MAQTPQLLYYISLFTYTPLDFYDTEIFSKSSLTQSFTCTAVIIEIKFIDFLNKSWGKALERLKFTDDLETQLATTYM